MIGLLGAKIWIENRVNFANPVNLVPISAGLILGIGYGTTGFFEITDDFQLGGIALGTIVIVAGYHLARVVAPPDARRHDDGRGSARRPRRGPRRTAPRHATEPQGQR